MAIPPPNVSGWYPSQSQLQLALFQITLLMCVSSITSISNRLLPPPGAQKNQHLDLSAKKLCVIDVCNRTTDVCTTGAPRHRS